MSGTGKIQKVHVVKAKYNKDRCHIRRPPWEDPLESSQAEDLEEGGSRAEVPAAVDHENDSCFSHNAKLTGAKPAWGLHPL